MNQKNRQPLLFMGAALLVCLLGYLLLYRHAPSPSRPEEITAEVPDFKESRHLTAMNADSFTTLLRQVYTTAGIERKDGKLRISLTGQGARASDFYNDNPLLLKVHSDEFSITHNKTKEEIAAIFTLHTEGNDTYIRVPNDILFQLTEKASNAKHG